ncbi:PIG-L deacetylase family protein [Qipengyuania flava]|uniref:PIG-L deacetylase family protein n=1 Tax=Qipengyuania flava TaxID=192812 RepID=UPI0009EDC495
MSDKALNLIVVAHPDDEVLAAGGTGARLVAKGEIVQPVMVCGKVEARKQRPSDDSLSADIKEAMNILGFEAPIFGNFPNIQLNTVPHLKLVQFIEEQITVFRPKRLFTHHPSDANDDHGQVSRASMVAARLSHRREDVFGVSSIHLMETPSATDWSYPGHSAPFAPNEYVEIGEFLERKIRACHAYRKVMRPFPHSRSDEAIRGLAAKRGAECNLGYAEAFQTIFSTQLN